MERIGAHYHRNAILRVLPGYQGNVALVKKNQDSDDIINNVLSTHRNTCVSYDRFARSFWKGNVLNTARYLFDFLKENVKYAIEPVQAQSTKEPQAILAEGKGDCKHYASFIVGVTQALKRQGYPIDSIYRFASYDRMVSIPRHVYAIVIDPATGKQYWVDPVLPNFDQRDPSPLWKRDEKPKAAATNIGELYHISGVNPNIPQNRVSGIRYNQFVAGMHWSDQYFQRPDMSPAVGNVFKEIGKGFEKAGQAVKKGVQDVAKGAQNVVKAGAQVVVKVAGAPSRNAFLMLVKLNAGDLAYKMYTRAAKDKSSDAWKRISDTWKKLGGNPDALYTQIRKGVEFYNNHHPKNKVTLSGITPDIENDTDYMGCMGEPGSVAAFLAAAAPVLAAMSAVLSAVGFKKDDAKVTTEDLTALADGHNQNAAGTAPGKPVTNPNTGITTVVKDTPKGQELEVVDAGSREDIDYTENGDKTAWYDDVKNWIVGHKKEVIIGSAIVGTLILLPPVIRAIGGRKRRR